jgi:hypothetical protein
MDGHRTRDLCLTTGVYAASCACRVEATLFAQTKFPACPECNGTVLWSFVRSAGAPSHETPARRRDVEPGTSTSP